MTDKRVKMRDDKMKHPAISNKPDTPDDHKRPRFSNADSFLATPRDNENAHYEAPKGSFARNFVKYT